MKTTYQIAHDRAMVILNGPLRNTTPSSVRKNSSDFTRADVYRLAFRDGFGTDEILAHSRDYAVEITGRASATSIAKVEQFARALVRRS